jgi:hypothetical protein
MDGIEDFYDDGDDESGTSAQIDPDFWSGNPTVKAGQRIYEPIAMGPEELLREFYMTMAPARRVHYKNRIAELEAEIEANVVRRGARRKWRA